MGAAGGLGFRKTVGWLLVTGTVLSVPLSILIITSLEATEGTGEESLVSHLIADGGILISLAFLLGMIGMERVLRDGKSTVYFRQAGLMMLALGLLLEVISWIPHLFEEHLHHEPPSSGASDLFAADGTLLVSFGISFTLMGVGMFALGTMNARLLGPDRALAAVLGVAPGILGVCLLLFALVVRGDMLGLYQFGNGVLILQVVWVFLIGLAFIRMKQPIHTGQDAVEKAE